MQALMESAARPVNPKPDNLSSQCDNLLEQFAGGLNPDLPMTPRQAKTAARIRVTEP